MEHTKQIKVLDDLLGRYSRISNPNNNVSRDEANALIAETQEIWGHYDNITMPDDVSSKFESLIVDMCAQIVTKSMFDGGSGILGMANMIKDITLLVHVAGGAAYAAGTFHNKE